MVDRRAFLRGTMMALAAAQANRLVPEILAETSTARTPYKLTAEDSKLLDEIQQAAFRFFWEQAHTKTGLVKDRSKATGSDERLVASVAATGFGLTALAIGHSRGY